MFSWYRETTAQVRRVFWTCTVAWGLDAADALVYQYMIPVMMTALGITLAQAGLVASLNYFASAIGGWLGGWLCDRFGRARILQLTILWFSVFSALSGFVHSYDQLLVVRVLQGLGFGAEWAVGAVLLGEMIKPQYRGRALGTVHSAAAIGSGIAALLAGPVAAWIGPDHGWRVVFWLGALPALLVLFVRRGDDNSEIYKEARRSRARPAGLGAIFSPGMIGVTAVASMLAVGAQGAGYAVSNYLTTFLQHERGLSGSAAGVYVLINSAGGFLGFLCNAWIGDRLGRRATFRIFALGFVATALLYLYAPLGGAGPALAAGGLVYGFFQFGIYASFGPFFSELFPTALRGAGQAFAYNFGRAMSFVFIQGVALLAAHMALSLGMMLMGMAGAACALIATFLLPETAGRDLRAVAAPALTGDKMTDDLKTRAALAQELQAQLADYWHDVDTNWGRNAGAYYTDDADFVGEAATYSGRAKIEAFYAWRVAQGARLAVHAVNNFRVETAEADRARATWYLLLYAANGEPVLPTHPPITISLVTDDYVRGPDGGWLCKRRAFKTLFQGGAPAHNPKL